MTNTAKTNKKLEQHPSEIVATVISAGGKLLASTSVDKTVKI